VIILSRAKSPFMFNLIVQNRKENILTFFLKDSMVHLSICPPRGRKADSFELLLYLRCVYSRRNWYIYFIRKYKKKTKKNKKKRRQYREEKKKQTINIIHKSMFTRVETCWFESKNKNRKLFSMFHTSFFSIYLTNHPHLLCWSKQLISLETKHTFTVILVNTKYAKQCHTLTWKAYFSYDLCEEKKQWISI
jgi:hypothetical protein